ncbi:hypothetical protein MNBD_BACTEROID05-553 [hydrothermal vent metagenome]|uniref:Uncharacterized protein n=1 Tax=hydrothermal vent metagenome TaxID=652676 RepID=A0A3B0TJM4_9ZZZZ
MDLDSVSKIVVTLAAFIGIALGIFNFVHNRRKQKVHLKVTPRAAHYIGNTEDGKETYLYSSNEFEREDVADTLVVEVINLSAFPVIIGEVGLRKKWTRRRMAMPIPKLIDKGEWPRKLEPRESVIAHFDLTQLLGEVNLRKARCAYAKTICGELQTGTSKALKDLVRLVKQAT